MILFTARLALVPFTPEFLRASLAGERARAEALLGVQLPDPWPACPVIFQLRLGQLEADPGLQPWLLRGMILQATRELVGCIGFHSGPDPEHLRPLAPGGVELGYTVLEPFRRRGLATEAAMGLMRWAHESHGLRRFVVSIRPDNEPSLAMAGKLGFVRIGEQLDEVDGLEHMLQLDWTQAPGGGR